MKKYQLLIQFEFSKNQTEETNYEKKSSLNLREKNICSIFS